MAPRYMRVAWDTNSVGPGTICSTLSLRVELTYLTANVLII